MNSEFKPQVEKLLEIKEQIDKLYEQRRIIEESLPETVIFPNSDGTWTRSTKTDNVKELLENNVIYRINSVSKYTTDIRVLKNKPKELKELND